MALGLPPTLLVSLLLFVSLPTPVWACSCQRPSAADALQKADAVVMGTVVQLSIYAGGMGEGTARVEVRPLEVLKGSTTNDKRWVVFTSLSDANCGFDFRIGRNYVIFAARPSSGLLDIVRPPNSYLVRLCNGTDEVGAMGRRQIAEIRALSKSGK